MESAIVDDNAKNRWKCKKLSVNSQARDALPCSCLMRPGRADIGFNVNKV